MADSLSGPKTGTAADQSCTSSGSTTTALQSENKSNDIGTLLKDQTQREQHHDDDPAQLQLRAEIAELRAALAKECENRASERAGRIRAEQKLRLAAQQQAAQSGYALVPVGTARTCFPTRNGTPRQGGLCPSARG